MALDDFRLSFEECRRLLLERLREPAPGRIVLLSGPRQVGKTTLLLNVADEMGKSALYAAADSPEAALPGFWDRIWIRAEEMARSGKKAVVFLDEVHLVSDWAAKLKGVWDRLRRMKIPVHVVATGSSALRMAAGSRESLAGRFERLVLTHWSATSLATVFKLGGEEAAELVVRQGSYPGAFGLRADRGRWAAYVRDAILEPANGRDMMALAPIRRPALLRQVFGVAASSPAQIVSLQKIQGQLQDPGALETIAHYLALLEEAYLVAPCPKFSEKVSRRRASPPKLVTLNNALIAVVHGDEPTASEWGVWVENACLAYAWNAGQRVSYWREEPLEVDAILEGSWGAWAIEVKTGRFESSAMTGLLEFTRRHPRFRPLVIASGAGQKVAARAGIASVRWEEFLLSGVAKVA